MISVRSKVEAGQISGEGGAQVLSSSRAPDGPPHRWRKEDRSRRRIVGSVFAVRFASISLYMLLLESLVMNIFDANCARCFTRGAEVSDVHLTACELTACTLQLDIEQQA